MKQNHVYLHHPITALGEANDLISMCAAGGMAGFIA